MNTLQRVIPPTIDGGTRRKMRTHERKYIIYKEIRSRAHTSTSNNLSSTSASYTSPPLSRPRSHKARLNREIRRIRASPPRNSSSCNFADIPQLAFYLRTKQEGPASHPSCIHPLFPPIVGLCQFL